MRILSVHRNLGTQINRSSNLSIRLDANDRCLRYREAHLSIRAMAPSKEVMEVYVEVTAGGIAAREIDVTLQPRARGGFAVSLRPPPPPQD